MEPYYDNSAPYRDQISEPNNDFFGGLYDFTKALTYDWAKFQIADAFGVAGNYGSNGSSNNGNVQADNSSAGNNASSGNTYNEPAPINWAIVLYVGLGAVALIAGAYFLGRR